MNPRILVIDDEPSLADTLAIIFRRAGYAATAVYSAEEALDVIPEYQPALVVTDVMMPGLDGIALAKSIRVSYPNCKILIFSGNAETQAVLESAEKEGHAFEVMAKPVSPIKMLAKVASLLDEKSPTRDPGKVQ